MRFPPASDIKRIRKSMDVTQSELSRMSGVGQSTIAKIEGSRTSASYETVVKLFETLEQMRRGQGSDMKAMDVASTKIVSIESSALVHQASDLMRRTGYSQLPVIDSGVSVGSISERGIFELLREGSTMEDLAHTSISKVMKEPFPVVSDTAPISAVTGLMVGYDAVLVSRKGEIVGMITNADILKLVRVGPA